MPTDSANKEELISMLRNSEGGLGSFMTEEEIKEYESRHMNHPEKIGEVDTNSFLQAAEESFKAMPLSMLGPNR
ncbi:MAG: hypothetical protein IJU79_06650 [Desulfovibrionaceae bacterium]|nr:hypothetical protein [Desulfovibrionaceae bacterium]